jgi:hypothetical protein
MLVHTLSDELKTQIAQKRLIFTVTTGRSGTKYLKTMLSFLHNVQSLHEPLPGFHEVLRDIQHDKSLAYYFWIEQKLPSIVNFPEPIYIEASHVFCKGFLESLLELGIIPDLIVLRRDMREVAQSMYRLGHIPARSQIGRIYLIQPDDPDVIPMPDWESMHDYQLCYWYCLEIERRAQKYTVDIRRLGGQVHETTLDEISTMMGFWKLIQALDLPLPRPLNALRYLKNHFRQINTKYKIKDHELNADWDTLEAEVHERIENFRAMQQKI